jgi:hypothetical protein
MFIGSLGSTHALRQEGNLFWRLSPPTNSIALLAEGGFRLCCSSINVALLPEGRPLRNVQSPDISNGNVRSYSSD